jgi:hypothetical protein
MASDNESDDCLGDEWEAVYGGKIVKKQTFIMAGGGSHAWQYELYENGDLYIARYGGEEECQYDKKLMRCDKDGVEKVKMVSNDYEPPEATGDDSDEIDVYSMLCDCGVFDTD